MVIFHSYVSLPEGSSSNAHFGCFYFHCKVDAEKTTQEQSRATRAVCSWVAIGSKVSIIKGVGGPAFFRQN